MTMRRLTRVTSKSTATLLRQARRAQPAFHRADGLYYVTLRRLQEEDTPICDDALHYVRKAVQGDLDAQLPITLDLFRKLRKAGVNAPEWWCATAMRDANKLQFFDCVNLRLAISRASFDQKGQLLMDALWTRAQREGRV